jgi:hypothetical protein
MEVWCACLKEVTMPVRLHGRSIWQERACCRASLYASLFTRRLRATYCYKTRQRFLDHRCPQREPRVYHCSMDTILSHETTVHFYSCTRYMSLRPERGENELHVVSYNLPSRTCHSWSMPVSLLFVAHPCLLMLLSILFTSSFLGKSNLLKVFRDSFRARNRH